MKKGKTNAIPCLGLSVDRIVLCVWLLIVGLLSASAQPTGEGPARFGLGLALGSSVSQISGDDYRGYRKAGLLAGVEGVAVLSERSYLSVGFLFNQVGSTPSEPEQRRDQFNYMDIQLSYLEIPVLWHILRGPKKKTYRWDLFTGLSVGRLLDSRITTWVTVPGSGQELPFDRGIVERQSEYKKFSLSWQAGLGYRFSPHFDLSLRHSLALTPFYEPLREVPNGGPLHVLYLGLMGRYFIP